jgi:hypothetical protein
MSAVKSTGAKRAAIVSSLWVSGSLAVGVVCVCTAGGEASRLQATASARLESNNVSLMVRRAEASASADSRTLKRALYER